MFRDTARLACCDECVSYGAVILQELRVPRVEYLPSIHRKPGLMHTEKAAIFPQVLPCSSMHKAFTCLTCSCRDYDYLP